MVSSAWAGDLGGKAFSAGLVDEVAMMSPR